MFNLRRTQGRSPAPDRDADQNRPKRMNWRRIGDVVLVVAAGLALIYAGSIATEAFAGYTQVQVTPQTSIRLQIVDGSGQDGLMAGALENIRSVTNDDLSVKIVETDDFDLRDVPRSYVVSRLEDCRAARLLAERLGLEPDDVEHRPLVNNRRQVTATLVLGQDGLEPAIDETEAEET